MGREPRSRGLLESGTKTAAIVVRAVNVAASMNHFSLNEEMTANAALLKSSNPGF